MGVAVRTGAQEAANQILGRHTIPEIITFQNCRVKIEMYVDCICIQGLIATVRRIINRPPCRSTLECNQVIASRRSSSFIMPGLAKAYILWVYRKCVPTVYWRCIDWTLSEGR